MKSNYKKLGDYIVEVKNKNTEGKYDLLLGINIDKYFMPSVANVVGTDLSKYKVVNNNQFACNRMHVGRDYRIPISLSKEEESFLVSPAYTVFEIKNSSELLPEYLMMWFRRSEFDRKCWFHTDADIRGGLSWELFCEIEFPLLSIDEQQIPTNYSISNIYPNPFNPATTISFSIPEFGLTIIKAYDINGKQLEIITNEVLSVGNYSINWNASSYPSGVYLIRMESGEFTQIQKVVLVK